MKKLVEDKVEESILPEETTVNRIKTTSNEEYIRIEVDDPYSTRIISGDKNIKEIRNDRESAVISEFIEGIVEHWYYMQDEVIFYNGHPYTITIEEDMIHGYAVLANCMKCRTGAYIDEFFGNVDIARLAVLAKMKDRCDRKI